MRHRIHQKHSPKKERHILTPRHDSSLRRTTASHPAAAPPGAYQPNPQVCKIEQPSALAASSMFPPCARGQAWAMGNAMCVLLLSPEGIRDPGDSINFKEHEDSCAWTKPSFTGIATRKISEGNGSILAVGSWTPSRKRK